MTKTKTTTIPLYPEDRDCAAPSATRILQIFAGIERHYLIQNGRVIQTFEPTLTPLQTQILKLLGIPTSAYQSHDPHTSIVETDRRLHQSRTE